MTIQALAWRTKEASLAPVRPLKDRNELLRTLATMLREKKKQEYLLEANAKDLEEGKTAGLTASLLDRLALSPARLEGMREGLVHLADLPDPLGKILAERTIDQGVHLSQVSVPFGVIAIIFEARPNVTIDCAGLCLKSGNACILKGGKEAQHSNQALVAIIKETLAQQGFSPDLVNLVEGSDRADTLALMQDRASVDLLIPRGGHRLIQYCLDNAKVPIIQTGEGVCHIYLDKDAKLDLVTPIVLNAKTQRPSVCNACECLLVHESLAASYLPELLKTLTAFPVEIHADQATLVALTQAWAPLGEEGERLLQTLVPMASLEEFHTEYLDLKMSLRLVPSVEEACDHIRTYGTGHSEAILTENDEAWAYFAAHVDAAALYRNASTRFTDGFVFGLGAEIGISTQKMHARGPMGLEALTTYRYLLEGNGQIRQ